MVKKGLMTYFPYARGRAFVCKNIGDYIQAIAARQYLDHIDEYIEQEEADKYFPADKKPCRLIMNGWFQWRAENWPPSEYVLPLLISMHISPLKADKILTTAGISFLKKNAPVGCRDLYTLDLLQKYGIPSYFSACISLTLGKNYRVDETDRNGVCFVDPYFEIPKLNILSFWSCLVYFFKNAKPVISLAKRSFFKEYSPTGFLDRSKSRIRPYYKACLFYKEYSKKFSPDLLLSAEYITHWLDVDMAKGTNDELLNIAENLVKKYASSKLVVTSRIHAGLPCLGLGTPVIFIADEQVISEKGSFNVPGRLGGLLDFFRIMNFDKGAFSSDDEVLNSFIVVDRHTVFENKTGWKQYAKNLEKHCMTFMNSHDFERGGVRKYSKFCIPLLAVSRNGARSIA